MHEGFVVLYGLAVFTVLMTVAIIGHFRHWWASSVPGTSTSVILTMSVLTAVAIVVPGIMYEWFEV